MPGPKCVVPTCHSSKSPQHRSLAFHKFPRDSDLKKTWLKRLDVADPTGFVCSRHFEREQYQRDLQAELLGYNGRRKLKPDAIPTINLPCRLGKELSREEKLRLARERHEKLIQECLNKSQEKTILGFDLFKRVRYSSTSKRGRPRTKPGPTHKQVHTKPEVHEYNFEPDHILHPDLEEEESHVLVVASDSEVDNFAYYSIPEVKSEGLSTEEMDSSLEDDQHYLQQKLRKLKETVDQQSKTICSLKRQILRERKMREKIVLASTTGNVNVKPRRQYDSKTRDTLLELYTLSPDLYPKFAKVLSLPSKSLLASWNPDLLAKKPKNPAESEVPNNEDDFQEQDFYEEEYVIQAEEVEE